MITAIVTAAGLSTITLSRFLQKYGSDKLDLMMLSDFTFFIHMRDVPLCQNWWILSRESYALSIVKRGRDEENDPGAKKLFVSSTRSPYSPLQTYQAFMLQYNCTINLQLLSDNNIYRQIPGHKSKHFGAPSNQCQSAIPVRYIDMKYWLSIYWYFW